MRPWIKKWWDIANDRRQRLIVEKHTKGLSEPNAAELVMLQKVADLILEYDDRQAINDQLRNGTV